ncbi:restriction endonuclease subunit S [Lactococcus lactis]|uniref:restriction endonuclease subunit S n=1 Tax=Lactococcus lactis TaxID=1358 RepID=UPI00289108D0|nr:restriction endonuclease subunit S [Lactococcus lactis]MDT2914881.1 restriction endonuclease subunit S [Lactococcus lactis]MDT2971629.1 restriction endonuclease subunit S [Lactococcus lactis]
MAKIDDSIKKKVPELRFKGFTDDWEQRKLTEIVNRVNKSSNSDVLPKVEFEDIVSGEGRLNKDISSKFDSRKGTLFEPENILYGKLRPYLKNWLFSDFEGVALGDFWVFEATDVSVPSFDYYLIQSDNYQKVANDTSGTKMPRSDWKNVSSTDFAIPSKDEQKQIGAFFKQLDNTIVLHQRRLDLLKEQKKGYLQKMFPKNGAKVPELRFAGFADDWEERKLSDVANHRGGTAIEKYFDKDGVYKVISIGSYGLNSQYVDQNIRAISNEITDGRVVNSGELTMVLNDKTANGTIIGRTLLVEKDNEYVINQRTEIISPKENFDSNFAYTTLNGPFREKVKRIVQGGTQIYVNYPAVSNLNLELPKIEEQQKIGSFFKQLDDTIALHQHKLDLLKEQKKGFLQKMFV